MNSGTISFEFAAPTQILFRAGAVRELGGLAGSFGRKALVVTGRNPSRAQKALAQCPFKLTFFSVPGEPHIETVREGTVLARREDCDMVIALGGGSALDAGKAIAAMLANPGDVLDYLEVIGHGHKLQAASAPFVAIPSTAGTGSEVTRNAVLASKSHRVKASLRSAGMLPRLAIVDPELTWSVAPDVTAATGMDALTQLIEPYVCLRANPLTDALCEEGLRHAAASLRRAFADGSDANAREGMCVASLFGGLALSNAGLGAVHGLAGVIGGRYDAPHGAICAALLPHVMEMNVCVLRRREPSSLALGRYRTVARILTGNAAADIDDGVQWVFQLINDLRIKPLRAFGLDSAAAGEIVPSSYHASSMKANPIALTPEELTEALVRAI
jgi:alcohol dehydrogenase class IV